MSNIKQQKEELTAKKMYGKEGTLDKNEFIKEYDHIVTNFDNYMKSKNTWFSKKDPDIR